MPPLFRLITSVQTAKEGLNFLYEWSCATKSGGTPSFPTSNCFKDH